MQRLRGLIAALLTACSSSDATPPDAAVADAPAEVAIDSAIDMGPAPCPALYPGDGNACTTIGSCTYKDDRCGGMMTATCTAGKWTSPKSTCEPYCPSTMPMPDAACGPADRVCFFWPGLPADPACKSCTCTAGKWSCMGTCTAERSSCTSGTACMPNTGCGAGRCAAFCACGTDAVLHCSANPC